MRWGLRSQLLGALLAVLCFGLATSWVLGNDLTASAVLEVRGAESRRLVELARAHLEAAGASENALLSLGRAVEPHLLLVASGADSRCPLAPAGRQAESRVQGSQIQAAASLADGRRVCVVASLEAELRRLDALGTLGLLFLGVTAGLALVLGYLLLGRAVVRPLTRLMNLAERVGGGEVVPIQAPAGAPDELARVYASFGAMTDRLRADREQIALQVAELQKANAALRSAQSQLVVTEKLASVGKLAAGVAHEIGNPVAVLQGYVELMAHFDELSAAERQRYLASMQSSVERISGIIRDLLDFARPTAEGEPFCDARAVALHVVKLVEPHKAFKALALDVEVPAEPVGAAAHAGRLEQVLLNLLLNAADASPPGGRVQVSVREDGPQALCAVEDQGPGVAAEDRLRIFDPFFTTKQPGAGTGLGLAICHGIVSGYGGTIRVEAAAGRGARFEVRLPRALPPTGSHRAG